MGGGGHHWVIATLALLGQAGCDPKFQSRASPGASSSGGISWRQQHYHIEPSHLELEDDDQTAASSLERRKVVEAVPAGASSASDERDTFKLWDEGPNFDTNIPQDVLALEGKTAYLSCRVFDRGNKTISWIRHQDLHILTVGRYTYTADLRYQSIYNPERDEWILQIKYVQQRDSGRYECQISTQPVRSFFVQLRVVDSVSNRHFRQNDGSMLPSLDASRTSFGFPNAQGEPQTRILGDVDVFMDVGSVLNLTCVVENTQDRPAFMLWYHGDKTIDYTSPRGGISVLTSTTSLASSTLLITSVGKNDNGKYSCLPSNAEMTSVMVHILEGEHHAAIHTNGGEALLHPHWPFDPKWWRESTSFVPLMAIGMTQTLMLRMTSAEITRGVPS